MVVDGPCDREEVLRLRAGDLGYCRETAAAPRELPTVQETLALPPPGLADRRPVAGLPCGRNAVVVGLWGRMHVLH